MYKDGAVKIDTENGFKLKLHEKNPEAPLSPIYLNLRIESNPKPGPLTRETVDLIGQYLWFRAQKAGLQFGAVAGLPNAGTPLAEAFVRAAAADGKKIPIITVGKKIDASGMRSIVGILDSSGVPRGSRVLIIDDLITEGHTKQEGIDTLLHGGYGVTDILVLVDRQQGGREYLESKGVHLWHILTLVDIVDLLAKEGKLADEDHLIVLKYLRVNP